LREAGHILCIEDRGSRFMNASVAFQAYRLAVRYMDESAVEEIGRIIYSTESRLSTLDQEAMSSSENYWPLVVEQMRDGFL
jgi:hypothetical protein